MSYTLWLVHRSRSTRPWCSCTTGRTPINLATILRPPVMALPAAGLAIVTIGSGPLVLERMASVELAGAVLAGVGLGLIGWFYPEAITNPADRQTLGVMT